MPITELESESSFMIGRPATNSYNKNVFCYQKDDIMIRFTLSGSSDITGHNNVYFLIYFFVYLQQGGKFKFEVEIHEDNIQLTLQRLQHGPLAHWDSRFSLQVTGSQHGSTISQFSGLPQSQASPSSTIPLPHDPKSGI